MSLRSPCGHCEPDQIGGAVRLDVRDRAGRTDHGVVLERKVVGRRDAPLALGETGRDVAVAVAQLVAHDPLSRQFARRSYRYREASRSRSNRARSARAALMASSSRGATTPRKSLRRTTRAPGMPRTDSSCDGKKLGTERRRTHDAAVQHAGNTNVVDVFRSAGDLARHIDARHRCADHLVVLERLQRRLRLQQHAARDVLGALAGGLQRDREASGHRSARRRIRSRAGRFGRTTPSTTARSAAGTPSRCAAIAISAARASAAATRSGCEPRTTLRLAVDLP